MLIDHRGPPLGVRCLSSSSCLYTTEVPTSILLWFFVSCAVAVGDFCLRGVVPCVWLPRLRALCFVSFLL